MYIPAYTSMHGKIICTLSKLWMSLLDKIISKLVVEDVEERNSGFDQTPEHAL